MIIREENASDHDALYHLVKTAFETATFSDGTEQDFMGHLRNSKGYIPALALVAEKKGALIGQVMLTQITVDCEDQPLDALLLAPLCVSLPHRNQGVGSALMAEAFRRARERHYPAVFLVGDPDYYGRFGFQPTGFWGIKNVSDIPDGYVMGCELTPAALNGRQGTIRIV